MATICRCGVELIGNVNRCWNCGAAVDPELLQQTNAIATSTNPSSVGDPPKSAPRIDAPPSEFSEHPRDTARSERVVLFGTAEPMRAIPIPTYGNPYLGKVASVASLVVGLLALAVSVPFPAGGAIIGILGIVASGISFRTAPKRAGIGFGLCGAALLVAAITAGLNLYVANRGRYPWQPIPLDASDGVPLSDEERDAWQ